MCNKTMKLTTSGVVIALYIVFVYFTQSISFGQYQIRLATGLYGLAYVFPFLCVPLGIANMLSNILFGGDIVNGCFGLIAGFITSVSICLLKMITNKKAFLVLPIAIVPSLIIPIWLSFSLNAPYHLLVLSLLVGQTITAYTCGIMVMKIAEKLNSNIIFNTINEHSEKCTKNKDSDSKKEL